MLVSIAVKSISSLKQMNCGIDEIKPQGAQYQFTVKVKNPFFTEQFVSLLCYKDTRKTHISVKKGACFKSTKGRKCRLLYKS
jgi:hypothetical protein